MSLDRLVVEELLCCAVHVMCLACCCDFLSAVCTSVSSEVAELRECQLTVRMATWKRLLTCTPNQHNNRTAQKSSALIISQQRYVDSTVDEWLNG